MIHIKTHSTSFQGNKQGKMKLKVFYRHSFTSIIFLLGLLILLCQPKSIDGSCKFSKEFTHAHCDYLDDIESIDPDKLIHINSLRILTVGDYLYPNKFRNLTNLKHLDLSIGNLTNINLKSFQNLHNLQSLNLSNNDLMDWKSGTLNNLENLHSLNLSENSFQDIPSDIMQLKNLKVLDITRNNFKCDCKISKKIYALSKKHIEISENTCDESSDSLNEKSIACMLEEEDFDAGMLSDEPSNDKLDESGEASGEDPGDILYVTRIYNLPDNDKKMTHDSLNDDIPTTATSIETPSTFETTTSTEDKKSFPEDGDNQLGTSPTTTIREPIHEVEESVEQKSIDDLEEENQKNRDDEEDEENETGSGTHDLEATTLPGIIWNSNLDNDLENTEGNSDQFTSTTETSTNPESENFLDKLWNLFSSRENKNAPSSTTDVNFEEEQFIPAMSTTQIPEKEEENSGEDIDQSIFEKPTVEKDPIGIHEESEVSKNGKIQAELPTDVAKSSGTSIEDESKKGMGSYIVLAVLLGVLIVLIGFATYKSNFCKSRKKQNNDDYRNLPDVEIGTEFKDLTKSLLDNSNSASPKISSTNGGKPEAVPLVTSSGVPTEIHNDNAPMAKYTGTLSDESVIDLIKPPRKLFSSNEHEKGKKNGTYGKIVTTPESLVLCPRPVAQDSLVNGKNDRDSLSSIGGGDSPSSESHSAHLSDPRSSQGLPPSSPHAQRVKIILQDNPDSVPKTPLLITRTKAGENLVKT